MNSSPKPSPDSFRDIGPETLDSLFGSAPWGIILLDDKLEVTWVNTVARLWLNMPENSSNFCIQQLLEPIWGHTGAKAAVAEVRHLLGLCDVPLSSSFAVSPNDWRLVKVKLPGGETGVACFLADQDKTHVAQSSAAFLRNFNEKLAPLHDVPSIVQTAAQAVGEHLKGNRCCFIEMRQNGNFEVLSDWYVRGESACGSYSLQDFGNARWCQALNESSVSIDNILAHPWTSERAEGYLRLGIHSYCLVTFCREGQCVAAALVSSEAPRQWTIQDTELLENVLTRTWPIVERERSADALRKSEAQFRALFDSIDEGFCTIEILLDEDGKPADYLFLQGNALFEQLTGLQGAVGKTAKELVPDLEPFWIETYGKVGLTGEAVRFESGSEAMNRWFDVHASRIPGAPLRVAIMFHNITERKRTERALAELTSRTEQERRLYDTILSSTPDLVYVFGLDHRFTYANSALLAMWGKTWEESIGRNCLELGYEPWHAAMHDEEIDRVISTKAPIRGEVPFNGALGRRIYDYIFVPVLGANGEVEAVAGTTRDVTARHEAETAIRLRTRQFETLLNQAPLGVYLVDDEFRISHVNPAAKAGFGNIPDLIGRDFGEVVHVLWPSPHADNLVAIFRSTLETGIPYETREQSEVRLDSHQVEHYQWRTDRITLPNGRFGVVCYFMDISSQIHARQRIVESEARFRTLVSVIADVPWVADTGGGFSTPQPAWENFTGQCLVEYSGMGWINSLHPEVREDIRTLWLSVGATRNLFESQGRLWHAATREWRYVVIRAAPVLNSDGSVREWVGACTDIDVQKRTEHALRTAKDEAERGSRAKDRFLAVLSHELRTPLTPVLMAVSALEQDPRIPGQVREDLTMVKRNIELETKLIDDLLDLSRITTGKLALRVEAVALHETIASVCNMCSQQARLQGVILRFQPYLDNIQVAADAGRLQQVLWNVIRNAIKFTPEGGRIDVYTNLLGDGRCEVRVADTGIGIPREALGQIFDAFEQGGSGITRQFGGLGLGLAISKSLVELHDGSIRAMSAGLGLGAEFVIEFPLALHTQQDSAPPAPAPAAKPVHRQRLLLVEDHADTLRILSRMLRQAGYEVITAPDVATANAVVDREQIDLLVTDLGLPDGDGYQIMRQLRIRSKAAGIAMSGFGMEEDMRRSREAGFSAHLVKPINIPQLLAAIEKVGVDSETRRAIDETTTSTFSEAPRSEA